MADASAIEAATRRLAAALDALEAALDRRRDTDRGEDALAAQGPPRGPARPKLPPELDEQAARWRRLESANREIAHRLDVAIDNIRSVLEAEHTGPPSPQPPMPNRT